MPDHKLSKGQKATVSNLLSEIRREMGPTAPQDLREQITTLIVQGLGAVEIKDRLLPKAPKPAKVKPAKALQTMRPNLLAQATDLGLRPDEAAFSLRLGSILHHCQPFDKNATAFERLDGFEQSKIRIRNAEKYVREQLREDGDRCLVSNGTRVDGSVVHVVVSATYTGCRHHFGQRTIEVSTSDIDGTVWTV